MQCINCNNWQEVFCSVFWCWPSLKHCPHLVCITVYCNNLWKFPDFNFDGLKERRWDCISRSWPWVHDIMSYVPFSTTAASNSHSWWGPRSPRTLAFLSTSVLTVTASEYRCRHWGTLHLTLCTATVQLKLATETVTAEKPLLSLITISVRGQMLKMAFRAQLD